jgi:hypothetical protein
MKPVQTRACLKSLNWYPSWFKFSFLCHNEEILKDKADLSIQLQQKIYKIKDEKK